ncbi:ferrochelatase-2 [Striga asiatica]|uniref:Ferrochelatase-2 n=1 Tax=Striga asiatica TaxID=4170 RepID=A0A5A7R0A0_STRAF|nr:ferrochelatase-2 [Striga asiatica]
MQEPRKKWTRKQAKAASASNSNTTNAHVIHSKSGKRNKPVDNEIPAPSTQPEAEDSPNKKQKMIVAQVEEASLKKTRAHQWQYLNYAKDNWGSKWVIAGDWNDILCEGEKNGGRLRPEASFWGFRTCLANFGGQEIYMEGYPFTWGNNRPAKGYIEEKLDRMVASLHWLQSYPEAKVINIFRSASDHNLLLLHTGTPQENKKRQFCFDKRWLKKPGIKEEIQRAWSQPADGSPMFRLTEKIKATRITLLKWSRTFKTESAKTIEKITAEMKGLRKQGGTRNWER